MGFLLQESDRLSVGWGKGRVAELRSRLTLLGLQGLTPRPLATVVPPVAGVTLGAAQSDPGCRRDTAAGQL